MKKIFTFLIFLFSLHLYGQEMIVDWDECFGSQNNNNMFNALNILPDGKLIGCTTVSVNNTAFTNYHGEADAWVLILNIDGSIYKELCFGGSNGDILEDIEIFENHIYFYGYTKSTDGDAQSPQIGGLNDLWVVKTDFDLNIIWEKKYGNLGPIQPIMAKATPTGGLVFAADFGTTGGGM